MNVPKNINGKDIKKTIDKSQEASKATIIETINPNTN